MPIDLGEPDVPDLGEPDKIDLGEPDGGIHIGDAANRSASLSAIPDYRGPGKEQGIQSENPEDWAIKLLGMVGDKTRPLLNKAYEWNRNRFAPEDQGYAAKQELASRAMLSSVWGDKLMEEMPERQRQLSADVPGAALAVPYAIGQIPQSIIGLGWASKGAQSVKALQLEGKVLPKILELGAGALGAGAESVLVGGAQRAFKGEEQNPLQDFGFGAGLHGIGAGVEFGLGKLRLAPPGSKARAFADWAETPVKEVPRKVFEKAAPKVRKIGAVVGGAIDHLADELGFMTDELPQGEPKFLKGPTLEMSHEVQAEGNGLVVEAKNAEGKQVGRVVLSRKPEGWEAAVLTVDPEFRRQGVATQMYKYVESATGQKVIPSGFQTDEGAALWKGAKQKGALTAPEVREPTALEKMPNQPTDLSQISRGRVESGKDPYFGKKVRPGELEPSVVTMHTDENGGLVATVNEYRVNGDRLYYEVPIRTTDDAFRIGKMVKDQNLAIGVSMEARRALSGAPYEIWERLYQSEGKDFLVSESSLKGTAPARKKVSIPSLDEPPKSPGAPDSGIVLRDDGHIKFEPVNTEPIDPTTMPARGDKVSIHGKGGQKYSGVYYGINPVTNKAVVTLGHSTEDLGAINEVDAHQVVKLAHDAEPPATPAQPPPEIPKLGEGPKSLKAGDDAFIPNPNGGYYEVKVVGKGDAPNTLKVTLGPAGRPFEIEASKVESRLPPGLVNLDELGPLPIEPAPLMDPSASDLEEINAVKRVYDNAVTKGQGFWDKVASKLLGGQARASKVLAFMHLRNQGSAYLMRTAEKIAAGVERYLPKGEARRLMNNDLDRVFSGSMDWNEFSKKYPSAPDVLKELTANLENERTLLDQRIAELGGIPDKLIEARINGTLDPYLARKYMLYLLPPGQWAKHVRGTEAFDRAVVYLTQELKKGGTWVSPERVSADLETLLKAPNVEESLRTSGLKDSAFKALLHRKDLPPELRAVMGEVKSGSLRMGITIGTQRAIVAKLELFQDIALDQNLSSVGRRADLYPEPVPDIPRLYGKLSGRYVKPEIYRELITLPNQIRNLYTVANQFSGWIKSNQLAGFGPFWTSLKSNIQGGIVSGGLSFMRPDEMGVHLFKSAKAMHDYHVDPTGRTGDGWLVLEAKKLGADWASQGEAHFSMESKKFIKKLYESLADGAQGGYSAINVAMKTWDMANTPNELFAHLLDLQDRWFRLGAYANLRRKFIAQGMAPDQAALLASRRISQSFPNPKNVGPAVQQLRSMVAVGAPYITAKAEDLRIRGTLLQRLASGEEPDLKWRLLGHTALFGGLTMLMRHMSGITQEEVDLAQASASKQVKTYKPALMLLAFRDSKGRLQLWDASPGIIELEMLAGHPDDPAWMRVLFNLTTTPVQGTPMEDVAARVAENFGLKRHVPPKRLLEGEGSLARGVDTLMRMGMVPQYARTGIEVARKTGLAGQLGKTEEPLTPGQGVAKALGVNVVPVSDKSYRAAQKSSKLETLDLVKQYRSAIRSSRSPEEKMQIRKAIKERIKVLSKQRSDAAALKEAVELQHALNEE